MTPLEFLDYMIMDMAENHGICLDRDMYGETLFGPNYWFWNGLE